MFDFIYKKNKGWKDRDNEDKNTIFKYYVVLEIEGDYFMMIFFNRY